MTTKGRLGLIFGVIVPTGLKKEAKKDIFLVSRQIFWNGVLISLKLYPVADPEIYISGARSSHASMIPYISNQIFSQKGGACPPPPKSASDTISIHTPKR